eukprot:TRINITY_DN3694_c1_g1_i2.p3 TRINITY_DN3694_c1_g1~~TRINITY_DN3694_c1_g1_i2.p3  ORF type:complete len:126 (-),score=38.98 TRINITY_DN3694_c1_g1_i2:62-388(-)
MTSAGGFPPTTLGGPMSYGAQIPPPVPGSFPPVAPMNLRTSGGSVPVMPYGVPPVGPMMPQMMYPPQQGQFPRGGRGGPLPPQQQPMVQVIGPGGFPMYVPGDRKSVV